MSLIHENTLHFIGARAGDIKLANYDIAFTLHQVVEPSNDPGWFLLNGATLSKTTYPLLFARFDYTFGGSGDNFNLPDYTEGKIPISMGLTNFTSYAASAGVINYSLTGSDMPVHLHGNSFTTAFTANSHGHNGSAYTDNGGGHSHGYTLTNSVTEPGGSAATQAVEAGATQSGGSSIAFHTHNCILTDYGNATEGFNKSSGGILNCTGGTAHNNMMPFIVVGGYLVKHD